MAFFVSDIRKWHFDHAYRRKSKFILKAIREFNLNGVIIISAGKVFLEMDESEKFGIF